MPVAIVGAGIGGSGAAYFLNELKVSRSSSFSVYLYEETDKIGGRVHATQFEGKRYEAGASIIHSRNEYATSLLEKLNLTTRKSSSEDPQLLGSLTGIYNGSECVFKESSNQYMTMLHFLRRYGLDLLRMQSFLNRMYNAFEMVYLRHKKSQPFESVKSMLDAMDVTFYSMTNITAYDYFIQLGLNDDLINELIASASLVNYGQSLKKIHAFVGAVALAGADLHGNLWSIEDGNERLPQTLAAQSSSKILTGVSVEQIERNANGSFIVTDSLGSTNSFNVVIIAHPLTRSNITFKNFDTSFYEHISDEKSKTFHQTVATFISGDRKDGDKYCSTDDLLICDDNSSFQSISLNKPVDSMAGIEVNLTSNISNVYKIFSHEKLTHQVIDKLFDKVNKKQQINWLAYPHYSRGQINDKYPRFKLTDGFYYINAIEWAASAMEMSLIGAKNVALLTVKYLQRLSTLSNSNL